MVSSSEKQQLDQHQQHSSGGFSSIMSSATGGASLRQQQSYMNGDIGSSSRSSSLNATPPRRHPYSSITPAVELSNYPATPSYSPPAHQMQQSSIANRPIHASIKMYADENSAVFISEGGGGSSKSTNILPNSASPTASLRSQHTDHLPYDVSQIQRQSNGHPNSYTSPPPPSSSSPISTLSTPAITPVSSAPPSTSTSTSFALSRSRSSSVHFAPLSTNLPSSNQLSVPVRSLTVLRDIDDESGERMSVEEPLRSPSLTKPFVRHPHLSKQRGLVYALAVVGGSITVVILLILLLASFSGATERSSDPYSSSFFGGRFANSLSGLRRMREFPDGSLQGSALISQRSGESSGKFLRLSSYLGSYLPFLDSSSPLLSGSVSTTALLFGYLTPGVPTLHPILPILRNARQRQSSLMKSQSKTYSQAITTYKRRYRQDPPPGFDKWWSFAKSRNHTMVDEYDGMMRDIQLFSSLTSDQLRARTKTLAQIPGVSLISIRAGQAQINSKSGKWAPALALQEMMNAFVGTLPDMDIAVNEKAEGRVLPGRWHEININDWDGEDFPMEPAAQENATDPLAAVLQQGFKNEWRRDGSVWEAYRRACPPDSASRRLHVAVRSAETSINSRQMRLQVPSAAKQQQTDVYYTSSLSRRRAASSGALPRTRELSFNTDMDSTFDLCTLASLHSLHSAFFSNTRSIQHLYPLFSPSKPNGFADLLIPFHQYWSPPSEVTYENEFKKGRTKTPADVDWQEKDSKVFWRGKVARGAETPPGHWSSYQKPRMVELGHDDGSIWSHKEGDPRRKRIKPKVPPHRVLVTLNATSSSLVSLSAPGPKVNEYTMDVSFACDPSMGECAEQQRLGYAVTSPGPMSEAWKHKYVLDLDEVGLSPKFPALMESKSAVVKSSMQREFWQDWIVPWYHYIPLSSSYAELYNIQSFFSGFPAAFQNRRSTSASSPSQDTAVAAVAAAKDVVTNDEVHPFSEPNPLEITLSKNDVSLKPINPAHGELFDSDMALKDIAEAGSAWRNEHMRREDMEVYVFRLLLEYARLLDDSQVETTPK